MYGLIRSCGLRGINIDTFAATIAFFHLCMRARCSTIYEILFIIIIIIIILLAVVPITEYSQTQPSPAQSVSGPHDSTIITTTLLPSEYHGVVLVVLRII
eukprot:Rmarinus@m.23462